MKTILAALVASTTLSGAAFAADIDAVEAPALYNYFVAVRAGYGPALIDNDFESGFGPGQAENDYLLGVSAEAGVFLTERFRLSAEINYSKVERDALEFDAGFALPVEGQTNVIQGFLKAGYEVKVSDLGLTSPIFSRSSIAGFAGIGFGHLRSNALVDFANAGVPVIGSQQGSDTVLAGQVGLGTVTRINDRVDFVSETAFVFGGDAEIETNAPLIGRTVSTVETRAITSRFGLRFKF